jgi:hypothetical protein
MLGLFRPLEENVGPSILTVGALCFVVLLGFMLKISSEFVCFPFVERDVSTVILSLEFYDLDLKCLILP